MDTETTNARKWHKIDDNDFMDQTVYHYGEYRSATHSQYLGIEVFSERVPAYRGADRKRVQHTVVVSYGAYGESVERETLPIGTKIHAAKARALEVARLTLAHGAAFVL